MTVKITIIGLGQIGASMGLALAKHTDQVTTLGHDKSPDTARAAQKMGAVATISHNLPAAVASADLIILAIPFSEIYETLKIIAQDIHEGAVLMDTGPVKSQVVAWMKELLLPNRYYIGLTPALNPDSLEDAAQGLAAARADLFQKAAIAISSPQGTAEGVLKLATDFVVLLGAIPLFADLAEVDGIMASAHLLPGLAAAALVEVVTSQSGWSDIRKLAGKNYSAAARALDIEETDSLAEAILCNRVNTVRMLDEYIATLASFRDDIASERQKELHGRLEETRQDLEQWHLERSRGDWLSVEFGRQELPKSSDFLKQQVGGLDKLFGRRKKKADED
jgi:prephenate dehydrogenase